MNRRAFLFTSSTAVSLGFLARGPLFGQASGRPAPTTEFKPLRRGVGVFTGQGGTIGWLVNKDGLVVVDTQFAATAAICLAGLPGRAERMIDCVINTHHHGDHTGGNGTFKPAAKRLVAHENVPKLQRAAAERSAEQAAKAGKAAPGPQTYADTLFKTDWRTGVGDEVVTARYFGPAHTSGDAIIHFEKANVVHMGDLVFNRMYPVVDRPAGARFRGWVQVLETAVKTYPKDAIYIHGHGNAKFGITGAQADLLAMRDYIAALLAHVEREIKAGKPKDEIAKLENLPSLPDYHQPAPNRLKSNLETAYDELTAKS
jgi:glyoxylase-like metal-dependent hydrolase (beta-lactamase superfamily II)